MRREERALETRAEIDQIICESGVLRLAFCRDGRPYLVPVSFGYAGGVLYCHSAPEGKKLDMLAANPQVCFECEAEAEVVPGEIPCKWSMKYRSVIGFGRAVLVEDEAEKMHALQTIMEHYMGERPEMPLEAVRHTTVIRIDIETVTGKAA